MARQRITVTMDRLSATLAEIFLTAATKNHEYIVKELRQVPEDAQRYITLETYHASGLNVITGGLIGENYAIPLETRGDMMVTGIRNKKAYAAVHELGGRAGRNLASVIPERPFIRPALGLAMGDFEARIMGPGGIGL